MRRTLAGAGLAVLVAVGSSACGSTRHAVTHSKSVGISAPQTRLALPPAANLVIVPTQRGAGDEQLGTFTASGTVYFEFSCKGKGPLTIAGVLEHISPCNDSPTGASVPYHAGERVHLAVRAKPRTTWRLAVGEHLPGATLVLVHRSGVGNKSLGALWLAGTVRISTSCKGTGNFVLEIRSDLSIPGLGADCPVPLAHSTTFHGGAHGRRAEFEIRAGPKARWSVTVTEAAPN